jgi:hypothetical protein
MSRRAVVDLALFTFSGSQACADALRSRRFGSWLKVVVVSELDS